MKIRLFFIITACLLCLTGIIYAAVPTDSLTFTVGGIDGALEKNATTMLNNLRDNLKEKAAHPHKKARELYEKGPKLIEEAIAPYGYFHPTIRRQLTKTRGGWHASFYVDKGCPVIVTHFSVHIIGEGNELQAFRDYYAKLPIKVGDVLNTEKYNDIKNMLFHIAHQYGFFDASMQKSKIYINRRQYKADIVIEFKTGPRFHFGKTTFSKTPFCHAFLKEFLQYKPGDPYDSSKLEESQAKLILSNYFNQVLVSPNPKEAVNRAIPITIHLTPRKKKQYIFGLGYGTDTGFRGTAAITIRHIGEWGHRFKMVSQFSEKDSSIVGKYIIPGSDPAHVFYTLKGGATYIDQASGKGKNAYVGVEYLKKMGDWQLNAGLTYLDERYNINTLPSTETRVLYPELGVTYINADDDLNPSQGVKIAFQLAGASEDFLSQTDFTQITSHLTTLWTLQKTKTRFIFRTTAGYTNISNLNKLPLSLQLLAGGALSVRGFAFNSIGPGRQLVTASTEVQQHVYKDFYFALFADAGAVGDQEIFRDIKIGVGPGIAWVSKFATLELTAANAISEPNKYWMIQFTMGRVL